MSLPFRYSTVDDYVSGTIRNIQDAPESFHVLNIGEFYLQGDISLNTDHVVTMLEHARDNPHLVELALHKISVEGRTIPVLSQLLSQNFRNWRRIHYNSCNSGAVMVLPAGCLVEQLQIRNNACGLMDYRALGLNLQFNRLLTKLELFEETFQGWISLQEIAEGIATSTTIEMLTFSYCSFDDEAVEALATGLVANHSLVHFSIPGCEFIDGQVASLVQGLSRHPTLQTLRMARNHCGVSGTAAIAQLLSRNFPLKLLDVSSQFGERAQKLHINAIAAEMENNSTLTELILSFDKLNDSDATTLSRGLRRNRCLQRLDLRANNIRDAGAKAVARYVIGETSVQYLYLFGNPLNQAGPAALLEAIQKNTTMEVLNLDYNASFYESIQFYACLNRAGRRALALEDFNPALWPLVLARAKKVSDKSRGICTHSDILNYLVRGPLCQQ